MSHRHESPPGYMDGVCVKISEKYKPPKRISLPMSCVQKVSSNENINNLSSYDFSLETSICDKMKELQAARTSVIEERKERLLKMSQDREEWEKEVRENIDNKLAKTDIPNTDSVSYPNFSELESTVGRSLSPCSAMLFSSTISTPSNILIPVQTTNSLTKHNSLQKYDYSKANTINISDFENDTSSPFDNMELKTLNDFEELALVLQTDVKAPPVSKVDVSSSYPYGPSHYASPAYDSYNNAYSFGDSPPNTGYAVNNSQHRHLNGYNYVPFPTVSSSQYNYEYLNNSHPCPVSSSQKITEITSESKSKSRSVPDIMKALQKELESSKLDGMKVDKNKRSTINKEIKKGGTAEKDQNELENPFHSFNSELQQTIKEVSQMGFPLPMVARAFLAIGNDREKVVEHLILMTQLLDLGFPEKEVAKALIKFDNDRDKALDFLIL